MAAVVDVATSGGDDGRRSASATRDARRSWRQQAMRSRKTIIAGAARPWSPSQISTSIEAELFAARRELRSANRRGQVALGLKLGERPGGPVGFFGLLVTSQLPPQIRPRVEKIEDAGGRPSICRLNSTMGRDGAGA